MNVVRLLRDNFAVQHELGCYTIGMDVFAGPDSQLLWSIAIGVTLLGGVIKGVVGFAMPMIMISGLSSIMSPDLALAAVMAPTLLTNLVQALRQGVGAAWASVCRFRVFLISGGVMLLIAAQFVPLLPASALYLVIGVPVTLYAATMLAGYALRLPSHPSARIEAMIGMVSGTLGGLTGVWGPPTVAMLTAQGTPKREQIRIQGVIYAMGAILFVIAHVGSGVMRAETLPLSLAMVPPAIIGICIGFAIQDRIDQEMFRRATLIVLLLAGGNLLRRGLMVM